MTIGACPLGTQEQAVKLTLKTTSEEHKGEVKREHKNQTESENTISSLDG